MTARFYLFSLLENQEVKIYVFRTLQELRDCWIQQDFTFNPTGLAHVGIDRPGTIEVRPFLIENPGSFLYTESFRWIVPRNLGKGIPVNVVEWSRTSNYSDLQVYLSLKEWGYDLTNKELALCSETQVNDAIPDYQSVVRMDDPVAILDKFEEVLCECPVKNSEMSARLYHILNRRGIKRFGELKGITVDEMFGWRGFGRQTLSDLVLAMKNIVLMKTRNTMKTESIVGQTLKNAGPIKDSSNEIFNGVRNEKVPITLLASIDKVIASLKSDRNKELLFMRLGFNGSTETLQVVGDRFGVHRERVRQIESKFVLRLQKQIKGELHSRIERLLENRVEPLYLDLIELEDDWFSGVAFKQIFILNLINRMDFEDVKVSSIQDRNIISNLNIDWTSVQAEFLSTLKQYEGTKITFAEIALLAEGFLARYHAVELTALLVQAVKPQLIFLNEIFLGFDKSIDHIVSMLLEVMPQQLHYTEYVKIVSDVIGSDADVGTVHNCLSRFGLLLGRGIYGGSKHFNISEDTQAEIVAFVEEMVMAQDHAKQWSCSELLSIIEKTDLDFEQELDKYSLNIILLQSKVLASMGRFVWGFTEGKTLQKRIDISQACAAILLEAGQPLHENELAKRISQMRGIDEYFLIHPTEHIARLPGRFWGLAERDFHLYRDELDYLFEALFQILDVRQKALHVSEICKAVEPYFPLPEQLTGPMVLGLTQTNKKFRVRSGKLLTLSSWDSAKRMNVRQAVELVTENWSIPLTMAEIREKLEEIVERSLDDNERFYVDKLLNENGIFFNATEQVWEHNLQLEEVE